MKTYKSLVESTRSKHAVVYFNQVPIPTTSHEKEMRDAAALHGDKHFIVTHKQDANSPLSGAEKVALIKKMMPQHAKSVKCTTDEAPTLYHYMCGLHNSGYTHVTVVTHPDKVEETQKRLDAQNGRFIAGPKNKKGYGFNKINVVSPETSNSIVAEKEALAAAKNGNFADLEKHMGTQNIDAHTICGVIGRVITGIKKFTPKSKASSDGEQEVKESFDILDESLYITELSNPTLGLVGDAVGDAVGKSDTKYQKAIPELLGLKQPNVRESYINKEIFNIGDMVETNDGQLAEIVHRGPNYVTLVCEGVTFKKWLDEVTQVEAKQQESVGVFGYTPKNLCEQHIQLCVALTEHKDKYAVLNFVKALDSLQNIENIKENFTKYKTEFDRAVKYMQKFDIDTSVITEAEDILLEHSLTDGLSFRVANKSKIANIIGAASGVTEDYEAPHELVNRAVCQFRESKHTPEGWQLFGNMLNHATSAGIQWDKNSIKPLHRAMGIK